MYRFKPLLITLLLSGFLFAILVSLGMKYQWTGFAINQGTGTQELEIPEAKDKSIVETENSAVDSTENFEPELIDIASANSLLESMTKAQIYQSCQGLITATKGNNPDNNFASELAVVNCVVSNYQETFQHRGDKQSTDNIDKKTQISLKCNQEIMPLANFSLLDKQLLIGICVSDLLSQ